ncbi:MAG TPA: hypothetical protein VFT62_01840 [Mycobacteriales bacterium]|nr:hypothetical protein [Mycobacteriales bacterium]
MSTPTVIAGWGAVNGVLVAILLAYGGGVFELSLYASVVLLLELVAVAAFVSNQRLGDTPPVSPAPSRSRQSLLAALVVAFVGLGLVYRVYMMIPAAYPGLALLGEWGKALWERISPDEADDVPEPEPAEGGGGAAGAIAVAGAVAAGVATARSRWRRRTE